MRMLRVAEFCDTGSGGTPPRDKMDRYFKNGTIPWVKSGELRESIIYDTEEKITEAALAETSVKIVPPGGLLLAMYGATVGRIATLGVAATTNQAVCHIVPNPSVAESRYLYYALRASVPTLVQRRVGGAQPNISQGIIQDLEVPLPPLSEQRRIAEILDKADALRAKRGAALAQLDTLTQSIFLDMFGDPVTNPKQFSVRPLGELIKLKSGDFLPASAMARNGSHAVIGGNGISGYHDRYMLNDRHVVIGRVGAYCGCVHVSPEQSWITDNALYVSEYSKELELNYLAHALTYANLNQFASKSGQPLVSSSRIYPVRIVVPPQVIQEQFSIAVDRLSKLKRRYDDAARTTNDLFASLQGRAFRGEL